MTNAYRIVNGEGDFLPGLIVDRYNEFLVCQFFTAGMDCCKPSHRRYRFQAFLLRTAFLRRAKGRVRDEEGIEPSVGVLAGEPPPELIAIEENGFKFVIDVTARTENRIFLDQRDSRAFLSTICAGQEDSELLLLQRGFLRLCLGRRG